MHTVIFETKNAIFYFDVPDAISSLKYYAIEHKVSEAAKLLLSIESSSSESIKISNEYFGYIVLDLLGKGKGLAFCKACQKTYRASQLRSLPVGFGKSPFSVNLKREGGIIKKLFGKKKRICGSGGQGYLCPHGHELIGMITWTGLFQMLNKERR
jgi:hypothetical protein